MGLRWTLNVASCGCAHRETWGQGEDPDSCPFAGRCTRKGHGHRFGSWMGHGRMTTTRYRELQREKVWSRIHLVPLLLAEGDRDAYRRQQAALQREREIMKDVKGWEVST